MPASFTGGPDREIAGILSNNLTDAAAELLPVSNVITSTMVSQHFGALLFEHGNEGESFDAIRLGLVGGGLMKGFGDAIEFIGDAGANLNGPFDLTGGTH